MASLKEIEATYDYLDEILRRSLGDYPDLSCAFYNGDFSRSLEQAQAAKHEFVLASVNYVPGKRVLDIGCGWGPMLQAVRKHGGHGVGVTISPRQAQACSRNNLDAHLLDWKEMTASTFGRFDAVVSLGAFEHFCSQDEYLRGEQDAIYRRFFALCGELLSVGGRLYLQTMTWKRPPPREAISLDADTESDGYLVALLREFYPGSWLPYGLPQIDRCATGFQLVGSNNGRLDYIQTMAEWRRQRMWRNAMYPRILLPLAVRFATSRSFRYQLASLRRSANRLCFEREVLDHWRLVFERVPDA